MFIGWTKGQNHVVHVYECMSHDRKLFYAKKLECCKNKQTKGGDGDFDLPDTLTHDIRTGLYTASRLLDIH